MTTAPRFLPAGDRVLIAEYGDRIDEAVNTHVHRVARALVRRRAPGIVEIVPTYRSVAVHFSPLRVTAAEVRDFVLDFEAHADDANGQLPRTVEIPVRYGGEFGPDLPDVAAHAGLPEADVVAIHAAGTYRVYMMGFTPGFPYLGGVSARIAMPRLPSPRTRVPAGSIGIAGQQTGVYPTDSPGGWRIIGRAPVRMFDPDREPATLLDAGDVVRFVPIDAVRYTALAAELTARARAETRPAGDPAIDVLDGGMLATVQDLGRIGHQRFGVPAAGAMDPFALRAANRLAGNADGDAGLEMTLAGPTLRFLRDSAIAIAGGDLVPSLNGRAVPMWRTIGVRRGDVLAFAGRRSGLRAYLAIEGGLEVPLVLGSRSTYLASGFGGYEGRALREGDTLGIGAARESASERRRLRAEPPAPTDAVRAVRVVFGPQDGAFTDTGRRTFVSSVYALSARSDRVGCRFEGPAIQHATGADIVSDGTAFGSVQVSGDGMPIVLMVDRGTTGGYTKIATVVSADLPVLAQMVPGDRLRFEAISMDDAVDAARAQEAALEVMTIETGFAVARAGHEVFDEDSGAALAAGGVEEFAAALSAETAGSVDPARSVRAGMTGQVVDVLVAPGQRVAERQTLVVVEAMKMQNPLRAKRRGTIGRVLVTNGDLVGPGTVVVEYDP
jgi:KipI family sensor histidine kinase inhibitor